jgi:hypothetical protein
VTMTICHGHGVPALAEIFVHVGQPFNDDHSSIIKYCIMIYSVSQSKFSNLKMSITSMTRGGTSVGVIIDTGTCQCHYCYTLPSSFHHGASPLSHRDSDLDDSDMINMTVYSSLTQLFLSADVPNTNTFFKRRDLLHAFNAYCQLQPRTSLAGSKVQDRFDPRPWQCSSHVSPG